MLPGLAWSMLYHNGQCRQNDQWWYTDYMPVGGYTIVLSVADSHGLTSLHVLSGDSTIIRRLHSAYFLIWWLRSRYYTPIVRRVFLMHKMRVHVPCVLLSCILSGQNCSYVACSPSHE